MPNDLTGKSVDVSRRLEEVDALLCQGHSTSKIERELSERYSITRRQVRKYIRLVHARWKAQAAKEAPHRRERVIRMAEDHYRQSVESRDFRAAGQSLNLLAKMTGAFGPEDAFMQKVVEELGPPPTDPTMALVWAQRCMMAALSEVMMNRSLDPERRLRWITEIGSKIGMTHSKTLMQSKVEEVADKLLGPRASDNDHGIESASNIAWPATSRFGSGGEGH